MKEIPEHIKAIIEKKFLSLQSPEDMLLLHEWCQQSEENIAEYRLLLELWNVSGEVLDEPDYNVADAWEALDNRLRPGLQDVEKDATTVIRTGRYSFWKWAAIAASITGIILLAGWWVLNNRTVASQFQVFEANGANKTLSLPDGSVVVLRKGASLRYPASFDPRERNVILKGEAFFTVRHLPSQPFRIETGRSVVRVLGTSFLVNAASNSDRVVVATGSVLFSNKAALSNNCTIAAKQEAVLTNNGFARKSLQDSNYLSWQTGILKYMVTPIDIVVNDLSEYYGIRILLNDSLLVKSQVYTITGVFDLKRQPVEQILDEIAAFTRLQYKKQKDAIVLF